VPARRAVGEGWGDCWRVEAITGSQEGEKVLIALLCCTFLHILGMFLWMPCSYIMLYFLLYILGTGGGDKYKWLHGKSLA